MVKKKPKRRAGHPGAIIDWDMVGKYLQAQCSATGIAGLIGIDRDTLYNRCKKDLNMDFSAFSQLKKSEGQELLREKQFSAAISGNTTMQIWLGKQYLGQKDKGDITSGDKPLDQKLTVVVDTSETAEMLKKLRNYGSKTD